MAKVQRPKHVGFADPSSPSSHRTEEERSDRMLHFHQQMVRAQNLHKAETIIPFAEQCQKRLEALGGWRQNGINLDKTAEVTVKESFLLSESQCPVTVLDDVLDPEMCRCFIKTHEEVGFAPPPSMLHYFVNNMDYDPEEAEDQRMLDRALQEGKNTSQLVQIESTDFADYLWAKLEDYIPTELRHVGIRTSGIYSKCGIIPTFRFMRYQQGQGFKPHRDPSRSFAENPLTSQHEVGIYESLVTLALYLNDPCDFDGGDLNFVKFVEGSYETQASVAPSAGRCAVFRHKELHEGGGVRSGSKYMCQCDVLYKRIAALPA